MTAQTSRDCYEELRASGALNRMQWYVYAHLWEHGPLTGAELDAQLAEVRRSEQDFAKCDPPRRGHAHKRLHELEARGVVQRLPARTCTVTGLQAHAWDVVRGAMPMTAVPSRVLNAARLGNVVGELRELLMQVDFAGHVVPESILELLDVLEKRATNGRGL